MAGSDLAALRGEWDSGSATRSSEQKPGVSLSDRSRRWRQHPVYLPGLSRKHENGKVEATAALYQLFEDYLFQRLLFACILSHTWLTLRVKLCRSRINLLPSFLWSVLPRFGCFRAVEEVPYPRPLSWEEVLFKIYGYVWIWRYFSREETFTKQDACGD